MDYPRKFGQSTVCSSCAGAAKIMAEMRQIAQQLTEVEQSMEERMSRLFKRIEKREKQAKELGLYEEIKNE